MLSGLRLQASRSVAASHPTQDSLLLDDDGAPETASQAPEAGRRAPWGNPEKQPGRGPTKQPFTCQRSYYLLLAPPASDDTTTIITTIPKLYHTACMRNANSSRESIHSLTTPAHPIPSGRSTAAGGKSPETNGVRGTTRVGPPGGRGDTHHPNTRCRHPLSPSPPSAPSLY